MSGSGSINRRVARKMLQLHAQSETIDSVMPVATLADLSAKLVLFMDEHIYPNEQRYHAEIAADRRRPSPLVEELKPKARAAGLWNLFVPDAEYGVGLSNG